MDVIMREILRTTYSMEKVFISARMVKDMKVNIKMARGKVLERERYL